MITWSLMVHLVAVALMALAPWLGWTERRVQQKVLVISLGGIEGAAPGPTTIGGRPVDEAVPEPRRPTPITPAATKANVMTVPEKAAPAPKKAAAPPPPKAQPKAPARVTQPPTTGRQAAPGNSRAETGVTGFGTGLQLGEGVTGAMSSLDDFCCRGYLNSVTQRIEANWDPNQRERGTVVVQFTIQRNGQVTGIDVQPGPFLLRMASQRAFQNLQLPPLPAEHEHSSLTLRLTFEYK
jgi:hypothetical protein